MFYFENTKGKRTESRNLNDIRRKAMIYIKTLSIVNVIDIMSEVQGYMGNIYKDGDNNCIWNPSRGKRLTYPDQTYLGHQQSYLDTDGSLTEKIATPIIPVNVYRK